MLEEKQIPCQGGVKAFRTRGVNAARLLVITHTYEEELIIQLH